MIKSFRILLLVIVGAGVLLAVLLVAKRGIGQNEIIVSERAINEPAVIMREKIPEGVSSATFAGGCFWCTEAAFQEAEGVTNAIAGYAGGEEYNPSYKDVYTESTSHRESLRVYYRPNVISYEELLGIYWKIIDPTDFEGQFVDKGESYTTVIFYENQEQKDAAEATKRALSESGRFDKSIATKILPFTTFYEAEEYHQDFYIKSADRYKAYANASGREEFKDLVWGEIQKEQSK